MKECDLYIPVREWLRKHGWVVHVEKFDADIVAIKDGRLLAVELKTYFTRKLISQCVARAAWADEVMAATPINPKTRSELKYCGIGYLQVIDGEAILQVKPRPQPWSWHKKHAYRVKVLNSRASAMDHEIAGLPACHALKAQRKQRQLTLEDAT